MADARKVKGIEKLTSVRLAEILTERSAVSSEVITDALYAQDRLGESFVQVLVSGGHITEWDLAKIVTEKGAAIDTFYVTEKDGSPVLSKERQEQIASELRKVIQDL